MSFSVTENASAVTDVLSLLSSSGFDPGVNETPPDLVIDQFDQWRTSTRGSVRGTIPCRFQIAA
jgi:hypothetical protein